MHTQFVMKLTPGGGPLPQHELTSLARLADENGGRTWIGSRKPGPALRIERDSRCLAFARITGGGVVALLGRIIGRSDDLTDEPGLRDLYEGHVFAAWWALHDVHLVHLRSLEDVPGCSATGKAASQTFVGSTSFAYWKGLPERLEESPGPLDGSGLVGQRVASDMTTSTVHVEPWRPVFGAQTPTTALYGVDFSGARERSGRNPKLWVAAWTLDGRVELSCGADGAGFGRRALAERISRSAGMWVLDFPFGPQADIAATLDCDSWDDYLHWAGSDDATRLRDQARAAAQTAGAPWSRRRQVDHDLGTTWFPFFEQLYRQTLRGAADVLAPLASDRAVRILPWHPPLDEPQAGVQVVEGFPGLAITRLGLTPTGYKGRTESHRAKRAVILDRLRPQVPFGPDVHRRALEDAEGDALDALVLLSSAGATVQRPARHWREIREKATAGGWMVEGWFFD